MHIYIYNIYALIYICIYIISLYIYVNYLTKYIYIYIHAYINIHQKCTCIQSKYNCIFMHIILYHCTIFL
jgi:hypothetical protein